MELIARSDRELPEWSGTLQSVNSRIYKDAWAFLNLVLQDQRHRDFSRKAFIRLSSLRLMSETLFNQSCADDKNAFDLFDALKTVPWDRPLEVNKEFTDIHASWRSKHAYESHTTPVIHLDALSRIKQFEARAEN